MSRRIVAVFAACGALCAALATAEPARAEPQEPRFSRAIKASPGWAVLALTPDVLDAAQPDLADLRIAGPGGDIPFAFEDQLAVLPQALGFYDVESVPGRETTALVNRGEHPALLSCVSINAAGAEPFLKPLVIEAGADGTQFRRLASASVFRAGGAAHTSVCFPPNDQRYLRFRFDDRNSPPIQPLTLETPLAGAAEQVSTLLVTPVPSTGKSADPYTYQLLLPSHRLPARALTLSVSDAAFSRVVDVYERILFRDELSRRLVGSARVERTPSGEPQLTIPLAQLSSTSLELEVERAGPPLHVEQAAFSLVSPTLVFLAPAQGPLTLRYGGQGQRPPPSDVREVLRKSRPPSFGLATLEPALERPQAASRAPVRGPALDPKDFASARELTLPAAGQTAYLDVDGELLSSLASLRIVDAANQQVPYVVERRERVRKQPLTVKPTRSDSKTIALITGLDPKQRVRSLELSGSGPEFYTRPVQLFETVRDKRGVVERRVVAQGSWARRPGEAQQPLELALFTDASELELEIDNGDNPPLLVSAAQAFIESTRLDFTFVAGDKLTLLAKNPTLAPPRYDLELIAATLIDSPGAPATLGPERVSAPAAAPATPVWFWPVAAGALALVVIVLLRSTLAKSEPTKP